MSEEHKDFDGWWLISPTIESLYNKTDWRIIAAACLALSFAKLGYMPVFERIFMAPILFVSFFLIHRVMVFVDYMALLSYIGTVKPEEPTPISHKTALLAWSIACQCCWMYLGTFLRGCDASA